MSMEILGVDANGEPTMTYENVAHRATFENGILEIFRSIDETTETKIVHQPWKFVDGERAAWDNIEEGVAWYKSENEQTGE